MFRVTLTTTRDLLLDADSGESARGLALRCAQLRPGEQLTELVWVEVPADPDLRRWQEVEALRLGTCDQRQRHAAGVLPDPELLALARAELFRPFGLLDRRRKRTDIHPRAGCPSDFVLWETLASPTLTASEWAILLRLHDAVAHLLRHPWLVQQGGGAVHIHLREHRGTCIQCGQTHSDRAALVAVHWAGRTLSREYAL